MPNPLSSLLLAGCGKMGGALLERWQHSHPATQFHVVEPNLTPGAHGGHVTLHKSLESVPADIMPSVIVLAVKPQHLDELLPVYHARFAAARPLYISIAAGRSLAFYRSHLGEHAHVVRAMPNTPALVGQGMTVLTSMPTLPESARHIAASLMEPVGHVEWLADESLMDAVTAISGSGPAYVFLFLDCLSKAAIAAGIPDRLARTLVLQTVGGSAILAAHGHESFEQLRKNVTSPGGTTEAALRVLTGNKALENLIDQAVLAAIMRAKELNN